MSAELALVHTGQSTVAEMVRRRDMLYDFTAHVMKDGLDYGLIPGTGKKTLLKPGAEKLCTLFNFVPHFEIVNQIEDWQGDRTGGEPLFYYLYRASLYRNGELVAQGDGSANSRENKYRFRWVSEEQAKFIPGYESFAKRGGARQVFEPKWAIDKGETTGKYGKPQEYWDAFRDAIAAGTARQETKTLGNKQQPGFSISVDEKQYRVPNPDVFDLINTLQKMAQKRALTAVVLIAANASELYTQDLEDEIPTRAHTVSDDGRPYDGATGEVYSDPAPVEDRPAAPQTTAARTNPPNRSASLTNTGKETCPECHAPAGKSHATRCSLVQKAPAPTQEPAAPVNVEQTEEPDVDPFGEIATDAQLNAIAELCGKIKRDVGPYIREQLGITPEQLTTDQAESLIRKLNAPTQRTAA